ncbi:IS3 family transposase [Anaeroglobus geminatus]
MTETDFNCYNIKQIKIKLKGMSPVEYRLIPKKSL